MMGALSQGLRGRLSGASAAALFGFCLGLAVAIGSAAADKVGVAAAVNPDAFSSLAGSPQSQLNIGKSIFYNERINTTTSGLVQVLLVDGSTFTVGPGSDLVIDKFVYDPKKKTGQVVATFSKGVLRYVGGKISKNEDGVTIKTPAGTLAIRGGMAQGNGKMWSFLAGVEMKFTGKNDQTTSVYEHGYTLDLTSGTPNVRPTTSADINAIMTALTKGGGTGTGTGPEPTGSPPPKQALGETLSLQQLIADATATKINDTLEEEEIAEGPTNPPSDPADPPTPDPVDPPPPDPVDPPPPDPVDPPPPEPDLVYGYAGGVYTQEGGDIDYDDTRGEPENDVSGPFRPRLRQGQRRVRRGRRRSVRE